MLNIGKKAFNNPGTKLALGAIGVAGIGKGIGSSAKEAILDTAFNDPYADEAFMGRPMSSGFLASAGGYGAAGAAGLGAGMLAAGALIGRGGSFKINFKRNSKQR